MNSRRKKVGAIERAVRFFAPKWAVERQRARARLELGDLSNAHRMALRGSFDGARSDRLYSAWNPASNSADAALYGELGEMRDRCRDLERNNPIASAVIEGNVRNVVGCGLRPQSRIDYRAAGIAPERARELQKQAEQLFRRWIPHADAEERTDFYGLQRRAQRAKVRDGEAFFVVTEVDRPGRPFQTVLESVEADRVDTPTGIDSPRTREGVVSGSAGQPIAYWINVEHPGDSVFGAGASSASGRRAFRRVRAWNGRGGRRVLHTYRALRPGQTRGYPKLAPAVTSIHDLGEVLEAERVAKRIEACIAGFITRDPLAWDAQNETDPQTGQRVLDFEPGLMEMLLPGEKVEMIDPKRPGSTFEPYLRMMLRTIGAAVELPLEVLLLDFSQTNFAGARAAILESQRAWQCEQRELVERLCQPSFEAVLEEAWNRREFDVPDFYGMRDVWTAAEWLPDGHRWVDPYKDAAAVEKSLNAGITSHPIELARQGLDWEENLRSQFEYEKRSAELREEMGLAAPPEPAGDEPEDDDAAPGDTDAELVEDEDESREAQEVGA